MVWYQKIICFPRWWWCAGTPPVLPTRRGIMPGALVWVAGWLSQLAPLRTERTLPQPWSSGTQLWGMSTWGMSALTVSIPGATVTDITGKIPDILSLHPQTKRIVIRAGANDIARKQSKLLKQDFFHLFNAVSQSQVAVFISGPTCSRGIGSFSRLLSLNTWLSSACNSHHAGFVSNLDVFWERRHLFGPDGLHLNRAGARMLSANLAHGVQHANITKPTPAAMYTTDWCPPGPCSYSFSSTSDHHIHNTGLGPHSLTNTSPIPVMISLHQHIRHCHTHFVNFNNLRLLTEQLTSPVNKPLVTINMALFNVCSLLNRTILMNDVILDNKLDCLLLTDMADAPAVLTEASPRHPYT